MTITNAQYAEVVENVQSILSEFRTSNGGLLERGTTANTYYVLCANRQRHIRLQVVINPRSAKIEVFALAEQDKALVLRNTDPFTYNGLSDTDYSSDFADWVNDLLNQIGI